MTAIYIATEDVLSEAVADRLIEEENQGIYVSVRVRNQGSGYLKKNIRSFTEIAHKIPLLLITDLDRTECPATLIDDWCGKTVLPKTFLFRIAVREIEAWLLADRKGFSTFSGVPIDRIPNNPESLDDPKQTLLNIVKQYGKRSVKADIVSTSYSSAKIGIAGVAPISSDTYLTYFDISYTLWGTSFSSPYGDGFHCNL